MCTETLAETGGEREEDWAMLAILRSSSEIRCIPRKHRKGKRSINVRIAKIFISSSGRRSV